MDFGAQDQTLHKENMMKTFYQLVMNSDISALKHLPPSQRFQVTIYLSLMWTTIFCLGTGAWVWYGTLVFAHVGVALGFLITGITFRKAEKLGTYRDHPRADGTARYDDIWGA